MIEILYISLALNGFFAVLAVLFSFKEERRKVELAKQRRQLSRTLYESSILSQVSEKIENAKDIGSIAQTITLTIEQLFTVSTASYAVIEDNEIYVKTYVEDNVSNKYVDQLEGLMKASLLAMSDKIRLFRFKHDIIKNDAKSHTAKLIDTFDGAYFHIPLVFHNTFKGIITISNKNRGAYEREDMDILYKIVKQVEHSIEQLEEVITSEKGKLDALIVSLPSGAILFTLDKGYLQLSAMNHAARDFLHITNEKPDAAEVLANFGSSHDFVKEIKDVMRERKSTLINEVEINKRYYKIFLNPVFSYGDDSIGVNVTLQDITREKEIDKIKETFTSMIVHELRAPLVSMKGASHLLINGNLPVDEQKKMLGTIKVSAEKMLDQVSDLLDSAKLQEGKFDIMPVEGNINTVIKDRLSLLSYDAASKHIEVESHLDETIPNFDFDPDRIGQVLNNLFSNSIKFTHEGGKITVISERKGDSVQVSVKDTGIGIPEDKKALLFSKYGQLQSIAKSKGTGLGLYITKGIVEAHKGTINLESIEGQGTTISFTLPIIHKAAEEKVSESKPETSNQPSAPDVPHHEVGHLVN